MPTRPDVDFTSAGLFEATNFSRPPGNLRRVVPLPGARVFRFTRSASAGVARIIGSSFSDAKSFADFSRGNIATMVLGRQWMWYPMTLQAMPAV